MCLFLLGIAGDAWSAPRAFVSSTGSDANAAHSCAPSAPCRSFQAAVDVVDDGGEVIALDAGGYGAATITKSVSLAANPGVHASMGALNGAAVDIETPGVTVTLKGLAITGWSYDPRIYTYGVLMRQGAALRVERCVISGFTVGAAIDAAVDVDVTDSTFRSNIVGLFIARAHVSVTRSRFVENRDIGIQVQAYEFADATVTTATISDSLISGNADGVNAGDHNAVNSSTVKVSITRSTISRNGNGVIAFQVKASNPVAMVVSESTVIANDTGFVQQVGALFESSGNNAVRQNGTSTSGTITLAPPI